jgi:eukaryotic-like serine/threonine-protein kinase
MTPERWRRVDAVLQSALDLPDDERAAFLDRACAGDDELRREVDTLLDAEGRAGDFIEAPAFEAAAGLFAEAPRGLPEGTFVSHYRVVSLVGAGGMGDVYRAEDTQLGGTVAIKLLPETFTADPGLRGRFLREARLASSLDHPNVCRILDVGRSEGRLFIAMEYVEGSTVKQLVASGPLRLGALLSIATPSADAIAAAHGRGVVHRDVKSSNIVVSPDGRPVVLDFGLAKMLDGSARASGSVLTRPGTVFGTPAYMSPEQARGEPADHRSDVFSLGNVIYEMATGRLPFERRTEADTLTAIVLEAHEPLAEAAPSVPPALCAAVDRALAKDPARRYQSMGDLRDDLLRCGAG